MTLALFYAWTLTLKKICPFLQTKPQQVDIKLVNSEDIFKVQMNKSELLNYGTKLSESMTQSLKKPNTNTMKVKFSVSYINDFRAKFDFNIY